MVHRFLLIGLCGGLVQVAAQPSLPFEAPVSARSRSGQFIVHGRGSALAAPAESLSRVGENPMVTLQPELLVVTAERVKRAVDTRFRITDAGRAKIHIQIRDRNAEEGPVRIRPFVFQGAWQYSLPLPDQIEWERLVRALVEVVLLERANRNNGSVECALVPLWLSEGMTQLLLAEEGRDLVAEPATVLNRTRRKPDPMAAIRAGLAGQEPLAFSELGLATVDELADPARFRAFQASAGLLTWELLRDDPGRTMLLQFLEQLPAHLNWQTTFLRTSKGRFASLLDVEKWWAVAAADTLAADPSQRWPRERVLERLDELLVETTEIRPDTNSPAVRQPVALAEMVERWDFATQQPVLRRKVSQLQALTMRAPKDLAQLTYDYARVLDSYVRARERAGFGTVARGELEARGNLLAASAARKLQELDRRLQQERSRPDQPTSSARLPGAVGSAP